MALFVSKSLIPIPETDVLNIDHDVLGAMFQVRVTKNSDGEHYIVIYDDMNCGEVIYENTIPEA